MELQNKLNLTGAALAEAEERISKKRARALYESGRLYAIETGTYGGLREIHRFLFEEIYDFAGKTRTVNTAKGGFRFASALYLSEALAKISAMPQETFEEIVAKYVEMNVAHPFLEGNGRSGRIWLDAMLRHSLGKTVDWSRIGREDYLLAMERSPVRDTELRLLLSEVLSGRLDDFALVLRGIDASYRYEGYDRYRTEEIT